MRVVVFLCIHWSFSLCPSSPTPPLSPPPAAVTVTSPPVKLRCAVTVVITMTQDHLWPLAVIVSLPSNPRVTVQSDSGLCGRGPGAILIIYPHLLYSPVFIMSRVLTLWCFRGWIFSRCRLTPVYSYHRTETGIVSGFASPSVCFTSLAGSSRHCLVYSPLRGAPVCVCVCVRRGISTAPTGRD